MQKKSINIRYLSKRLFSQSPMIATQLINRLNDEMLMLSCIGGDSFCNQVLEKPHPIFPAQVIKELRLREPL